MGTGETAQLRLPRARSTNIRALDFLPNPFSQAYTEYNRSSTLPTLNKLAMASENPSVDALPELSAAQKLQQMHATVEDVQDDEQPSNATQDATSGSWAAPISATAAGKQKETTVGSKKLDTGSHELFPELGAAKGKSANVTPIWGAKAKAGANGAGSNGVSRSSTPASGAGTPQMAAPSLSIPGRNVESVTLEPQFLIPSKQLKRPIPDMIKDINRKSRANITMSTAPNGRLKFDATGPQEVAQQALKDLVQQIGSRVSLRSLFSESQVLTPW